MSEDAYAGDAQFTVKVDGKQVGGTYTANVLHASGDGEVFKLTGNWAAGGHDVQISFINDAYGGSAAMDRNLYVNSVAFNGTTYANTSSALYNDGTSSVTVGGATATAAAPPDTITLNLAEDAYQGNAQFVMTLDGKTITTPESVTALNKSGQTEAFTYSGKLGAGSHTLGVTFTNDAYGGSATTDRNLYSASINVNGQHYGSGVTELYTTGATVNYNFTTAH